MSDQWKDNIRVHYEDMNQIVGSYAPYVPDVLTDRTAAQKAQDQILENAEKAALDALNKTKEAIEWLGVVTPVTARTAPVYLRQLLAEIVEVRRVRQ